MELRPPICQPTATCPSLFREPTREPASLSADVRSQRAGSLRAYPGGSQCRPGPLCMQVLYVSDVSWEHAYFRPSQHHLNGDPHALHGAFLSHLLLDGLKLALFKDDLQDFASSLCAPSAGLSVQNGLGLLSLARMMFWYSDRLPNPPNLTVP